MDHDPFTGDLAARGFVGNVGNVGKMGELRFADLKHEPDPEDGDFPTIPTDPGELGKAIYPVDSILEDWMRYVRQYAESADCYLIGSVLPVVGAMMGRRVWYQLDRKKYPNLFVILSGKPGDRKTTAIKQAEALAKRLLKPERFSPSMMSLEGLIDQYDESKGGSPDKILIADDANSVLANWSESSYGKIVSKKYLELYDCGELREAFLKNAEGNNRALRVIGETSTSILFGATFNICRFQKLETRDGMGRRFLYYVAEKIGRFIPNPPQVEMRSFVELATLFDPLRKCNGQMGLSSDAQAVWVAFQKKNRLESDNAPMNDANVAYLSALTEVPSQAIKLAMLFNLCRYAKGSIRKWDEIGPDSLSVAIEHVQHCLSSSRCLETISQRALIKEEAETIYAQVISRFGDKRKGDVIALTKTELTNAFAKNPGRFNGLKPSRLYGVLLPWLAGAGLLKVAYTGSMRGYFFESK